MEIKITTGTKNIVNMYIESEEMKNEDKGLSKDTGNGKIFISVFAGFGILSFATSLIRYDYAYRLV